MYYMDYLEVKGNLITLANAGEFDVIVHGCNCFNTQRSGIAVEMDRYYGTSFYRLEAPDRKGDINKLGCIDGVRFRLESDFRSIQEDENEENTLMVLNAYTQYTFGKGLHLDYEALTLCLRKINLIFKGKRIGLPQIGCGLAGGDWGRVKQIIQKELTDVHVTVVFYEK